MLYLFLDKNQIKLLSLKKSLLGQYETVFFEKKYQTDLLVNGKVEQVDYVASAIKEVFNASALSDKDVYLILPQESFAFFRAEVPMDIAQPAVGAFVKDKARANLSVNLDECAYDFLVTDNENKKQISFYAIEIATIAKIKEAFSLIDLKLEAILPETLAYFKLFEKTLRKEKYEHIWYVSYNETLLSGYLYDSYGLQSAERWSTTLTEDKPIEKTLREKAEEYEKNGKKLNRLILSGEGSDTIRQDTFTKDVGVWTNPLKRIIANFYQEYIKLLVTGTNNKPFPILTYDTCFGAFIFAQENKSFSLFKSGSKQIEKATAATAGGSKISLPKTPRIGKEVLIFVGSFAVSFLILFLIFQFKPANINIAFWNTPTATPVPSPTTPPPTPTPTLSASVNREDVQLKILNGSGTAGKAGEMEDEFSKLGYSDIVTDNADNFDYEKTVLQVKDSQKDVGNVVATDLKKIVPGFETETLDASNSADVVIIVGKDF